MAKVGIIGGSGLENPEIIAEPEEVEATTRFGDPSSTLTVGKIRNVDVVILSRHDRNHRLPPTQIPNRANLQALKDQGCTHVLATTAVGSLREEIGRGDFVILDQFIDFTRRREVTVFDSFENGLHHVAMPDPFDGGLRRMLFENAKAQGISVHERGTVVTIEGPRFSTRAESHMFRAWGADVINMSIAPECIIANELELPYAAVAMSTDYDCWKEDEEAVTWEAVLSIFKQNAEKMTSLLIATIPEIPRLEE
ncbi:MAG: S-methyl-5'-thioadenosine phosphorylase [Spirochaetaceae bacterium]